MAVDPIQHEGIVSRMERDAVFVKITSQSACGSCSSREACGLAEAQDKIIEVHTSDVAQYAVGDSVLVGINKKAGSYAVFFAYILSLGVLLVLLILGLKVMGWSEGMTVVMALSGVVIYYVVLWLFRSKLEDKIQITITKNY